MKNQIKVSIIIPVYNVEKYIRANVESLIAIRNTDIEFLYIDDGSLDQSISIIQEYQKKDHRIQIISRKNGGLSAARNTGIAVANGEWILFVDGDDWVDPALTEKIIDASTDKNDIVWGTYEIVTESGKLEKKAMCDSLSVDRTATGIEWVIEQKVTYSPWVYLYKTTLIKENMLKFPEGFVHEDMEFIPEVFYFAQNVKYIGVPFYKYVNRKGSISRTKNIKRSSDLIQIAQHIDKFEKEKVTDLDYKNYLQSYKGFLCSQAVHIAILDGLNLSDIFTDKELRNIAVYYLMHSTRKRDKVVAIVITLHLQWLYEKLYQRYNNHRANKWESY